jgi:maltose alpha-D-glucosyltransferase/alpha-amylase
MSSRAASEGSALLAFLSRQRWFGAKGAAPTAARIAESAVVPWGNGRWAIARAVVDVDGAEHSYQLAIATDGSSFDVTNDSEFRHGLVRALVAGERFGDWAADPIPESKMPNAEEPTAVASAEQSNTSIIVGQNAIVKLFRMLKPGIHPDVEVTRFLTTRAGFANTPRLLSSATLGDATAAMMQEFIPGSQDAWSYALERGRDYFAAPKGKDLPNRFVDDARKLGAITREMHAALASGEEDPAFAPEDVEHEDLDTWARRTKHTITESIALLEKHAKTPEAQALVRRRDHYLGWIDEIDDELGDDAGAKIRIHGDYHLGQVLRSPDGEFFVIDFEGEPSRSIEERRAKSSPLRDVAGMLRSVAYAAATLATEQKQLDMPTRETRVARWERDVRAAFLDGYLKGMSEEDEGILPPNEQHIRRLISLFEAEKAFYELAYELNNRPDWSWIPMRGISKLFMAR